MLGRAIPVLPAEDLARARKFYGDEMGLAVSFETADGIAFSCEDGSGVYVYLHERTLATHTAATFVVSDLDAEVATLRSRGVVFEDYDLPGLKTVDGISDANGVRGAWIVDPEGNILSVIEG